MRFFSNRNRPMPLGRFPLERLKRTRNYSDSLRCAARIKLTPPDPTGNALADACLPYRKLYESFRTGDVAEEIAPYTEDVQERADDLLGLAYFFDVTMASTCRTPSEICSDDSGAIVGHDHAIVFLVEHSPCRELDNPAYALVNESGMAAAKLRAAEVSALLALYLRRLGLSAVGHSFNATDVSLEMLAVRAGLCRVDENGLDAPFIGNAFAIAAVTTNLVLPDTLPLAPRRALEGGVKWAIGWGGTDSAFNRWRLARRPADIGPYPMETIKRVADTTTLILHDEVPRVPKRANGFFRAMKGDLGEKAKREVFRFSGKSPLAAATRNLIGGQQPMQDGPVADIVNPSTDPEINRRMLKTLTLHLGADLVGTCEAKRYVWFSHHLDGTPIDIYHRNAVAIIVDQGFETMEGASGDDWVSVTQSMRAYMRGAQIVGVASAWIRSQGHSARAHTNIDSDVIQTPVVLLAGLGEMSRIGEVILNPFVGPRSKSAVLTTNMPLAWDQPVDFGLQDTCSKCSKCARECPCDAITFGGTVMFNGYEQWKQDVQRCTSYRITNQGGSACGRCMKTCPLNHEGIAGYRFAAWLARKFPAIRGTLVKLDDKIGKGTINETKRWWQDLELKDGKVVRPARINRRTLDPDKDISAMRARQKIAYTNADMLPAPDEAGPHPLDRGIGQDAVNVLESVEKAKLRKAEGGQVPSHYIPTPPLNAEVRSVPRDQDPQEKLGHWAETLKRFSLPVGETKSKSQP